MKVAVDIRLEMEAPDEATASDVVDRVLDNGDLQDAVADYVSMTKPDNDETEVASATIVGVVRLPDDEKEPSMSDETHHDDDTQFVIDVLSVYGDTRANDVVASDGVGTARRLATALKTGMLTLVFHDDLEDLAKRLLGVKDLAHAVFELLRGVPGEDAIWAASLVGDGFMVAANGHTLTEAVEKVFEGVPGEMERRADFVRRCKRAGLTEEVAYTLVIPTDMDMSPSEWAELWKGTEA